MRGCGEVLVGSTLRIVPHESVDATMRGQNQTIPTREVRPSEDMIEYGY